MALDIATLGIEVKSTSVTKATQNLDGLQKQANKTNTSINSLASSVDKSNKISTEQNTRTLKSSQSLNSLAQQTTKNTNSNRAFTSTLVSVNKRLQEAANNANRTAQGFAALGYQAKSASSGMSSIQGSALASSDAFHSLAGTVMATVASFFALQEAGQAVRRGFDFSAEMESSQIGIASILTATTALIDVNGQNLQGVEKYNEALRVSASLMDKVRIQGLETTATTRQLVESFQSVIGPAAAVGLSMEETQEYALGMVKAAGAIGLPMFQLPTEMRSILEGSIVATQDRLAMVLGITNDMVRDWKQQGILAEELQRRLAPFTLAGKDVANSWAGISSNMSDALDVLSAYTGRGIFEGMKEAYKSVFDSIIDIRTARPGEDIALLAESVKDVKDAIGDGIVLFAEGTIDFLKFLNDNIDTIESVAIPTFDLLTSSIDELIIAYTAYTAIQKLSTSETLLAFRADTQLHGLKATLLDRVTQGTAAEQARTAALAQQATVQKALISAEIQALEVQKTRDLFSVRRADQIAVAMIGTQNEARAVAVLENAEKKLIATDNALSASQARLSAVMATTTRATGILSASMNGLRSLGSGFVSMLGGPWVAGITAAAVGLYALYDTIQENKQALIDSQDAFEELGKRISEATGEVIAFSDTMQTAAIFKVTEELNALKEEFIAVKTEAQGFLGAEMGWMAAGLGLDLGAVSGSVTQPLIDIRNEALSAMEATDDLQKRYEIAADAIAQLDLLEDTWNENIVDQVQKDLQDIVVLYEQIQTKEKELEGLTGVAESAELATVTQNKLNEDMETFNSIVNEFNGENVVNSLQSATEYAAQLIEDSQLTADAQEDVAKAAEEATRQFLQQHLLAAQLANDLEQIAKASTFLNQFEAAVEAGPADRTSRRTTGGGGSGVNNVERAQQALERLNLEMAKMRGEDTSELELVQKLAEVEKTAREAGVSASEFTEAYRQAFEAQRTTERQEEIADIEKQIASLLGQDRIVQMMELNSSLDEMRNKLTELGVPITQQTELLERYSSAMQQSVHFEDLQVANEFMQELASLTGDYGMALEAQNAVLAQQAEIYRQSLPEALHAYVDEWEQLQQIQQATDPFSGMYRGMQKWVADSSNMASGLETTINSAFDGMADALATFVTTGKLDFSSLANSIIADLAKIAVQAAMSNVLGSLFGGGGGFFSGIFAANGAVAPSGISGYSNSIVTAPTFFSSPTPISMFANGGGIMGEAGPEAIMPLSRDSSGRLGVSINGVGKQQGQGIVINQTVNIQTSGQAGTDGFTPQQMVGIQKQLKDSMKTIVQEEIFTQRRAGGSLSAGGLR